MYNLNGKVALVTGGAEGIGLAYIEKLLLNGCRGVSMVDINEKLAKKSIEELNVTYGQERIIFIKADVTSKRELEGAFETTVQTFNQLDIVINNAGIGNEEDFEMTIAINLTAVVRGCHLAMETYLPKYKIEEGVIVNTASIGGISYSPAIPTYSATKHGVVALGKCLSFEYDRTNVRILTLCPGATTTNLIKYKGIADVIEKLNIKQFQSPEDVGEALITILREGENGSIWVCDGKPVYEIKNTNQNILQ